VTGACAVPTDAERIAGLEAALEQERFRCERLEALAMKLEQENIALEATLRSAREAIAGAQIALGEVM
jgi:hypothetical protein